MTKVIHVEKVPVKLKEAIGTSVELLLRMIYSEVKLMKLTFDVDGKSVEFEVIDKDYPAFLAYMRLNGLTAYINEDDYSPANPHPEPVFKAWQIPYQTYKANSPPNVMSGDILVFSDVRCRTAIFRVLSD